MLCFFSRERDEWPKSLPPLAKKACSEANALYKMVQRKRPGQRHWLLCEPKDHLLTKYQAAGGMEPLYIRLHMAVLHSHVSVWLSFTEQEHSRTHQAKVLFLQLPAPETGGVNEEYGLRSPMSCF